MGHAVPLQVLFHALHLIAPMLQTCAEQKQQRNVGGGGASGVLPTKARLATCLIMSPDYPLERFVTHDFNRLRKLCSNICLFCDTSDQGVCPVCRTRALSARWTRVPAMHQRLVPCSATASARLDGAVGRSTYVLGDVQSREGPRQEPIRPRATGALA